MTSVFCIVVVSFLSDVMSDFLHVQFSNMSCLHASEEAHSILARHLCCDFSWPSDSFHGEGNALF